MPFVDEQGNEVIFQNGKEVGRRPYHPTPLTKEEMAIDAQLTKEANDRHARNEVLLDLAVIGLLLLIAAGLIRWFIRSRRVIGDRAVGGLANGLRSYRAAKRATSTLAGKVRERADDR